MKLKVTPVQGRVGKCRQVAAVEIEVAEIKVSSRRASYPYHEVEQQIDRAFHRFIKDHLAEAVVSGTDLANIPTHAEIISGDRQIARFKIEVV